MGRPAPLIWIDLEMTGLDPERDVIIEMATLVTDSELNILAEGPELVIHQDPALFDGMDAWNKEQHTKSGLWAQVVASKVTQAEAEAQTLAFVKRFAGPKEAPLAGNSVWQDRRFLCRYMQQLDAHLHYRLVDVSTVKELAARWTPEAKFVKAKGLHRALEDIRESVAELKYYREILFRSGIEVTAKLAAKKAEAGGKGG